MDMGWVGKLGKLLPFVKKAASQAPVTISAPPAAAVTIDAQNPLPEPSFVHRRIIAYVVVLVTLWMVWHTLEALHDLKDSAAMLNLAWWQLAYSALIATYYYVAPSASELTNMIQTAKIVRSGLGVAAEQAQNRPETGAGAPPAAPAAPESRIPAPTPGRPLNRPGADAGEEQDFAPMPRRG